MKKNAFKGIPKKAKIKVPGKKVKAYKNFCVPEEYQQKQKYGNSREYDRTHLM